MPTPNKTRNQNFKESDKKPKMGLSSKSLTFDPDEIMKRLKTSSSELRKILTEATEALEMPQYTASTDMRKKKDRVAQGEDAYNDKSAVVMNLEAIKKGGKDETDLLIKVMVETLKDAESMFAEEELVAKNIVIDLTKMFNELKAQADKIDPEKLERIEEYRKEFQYFQTAWSNVEKSIKKAEEKRQALLQKWEEKMAERERQEEELQRKFKLDKYYEALEQVDAKVFEEFGGSVPSEEEFLEILGFSDEVEIETSQGTEKVSASKAKELTMKKTNEMLRKRLRDLRGILTEHYTIPLDAAKSLTLYMKGYGLTASLSTMAGRNFMSQEGFEVLKNSFPDVYEEMKKYITFVDYEDQFKTLNTKIPEISNYFIQIKDKYDGISDTFENALSKSVKKEGVISDIAKATVAVVVSKFTKYFKNVITLFKGVNTRLTNMTNDLGSTLKNDRKALKALQVQSGQKVLKFKSDMAKAQSSRYDGMNQKLSKFGK